MDAGDFIYIIIAIVLAVLNAVANSNKKKKQALEKKQQTVTQTVDEDILEKKLRELLGEEPVQAQNDDANDLETEPVLERHAYESPKETETQPLISYGEAGVSEAEATIDKPLSEEELYPVQPVQTLDVVPVSEAYSDIPISRVEGPIGDYDFQESLNETLVAVDKGEQPDEDSSSSEALPRVSVMDDFDPLKALIYSEIIHPKYF